MMAQVLRKIANPTRWLIGPDRQLRTYWTQWRNLGLRQRSFNGLRDEQEQDNLECTDGTCCERTTWTGDRRDKSELSREDVHDTLQGMQDLHEIGLHSWATAERVARHAPRATPARQCVWKLASVGDLAKIKTKKRQAEHRSAFSLALRFVFDKRSTERNRQEDYAIKLAGTQLGKTNVVYGDIMKNRQRVRHECSKLISNYIEDQKVIDKAVRMN